MYSLVRRVQTPGRRTSNRALRTFWECSSVYRHVSKLRPRRSGNADADISSSWDVLHDLVRHEGCQGSVVDTSFARMRMVTRLESLKRNVAIRETVRKPNSPATSLYPRSETSFERTKILLLPLHSFLNTPNPGRGVTTLTLAPPSPLTWAYSKIGQALEEHEWVQ